VTYELETREGARYTLTLPYVEYESIEWAGHDDHYTRRSSSPDLIRDRPDGRCARDISSSSASAVIAVFRHVCFRAPPFDLYVSDSQKVLLLQGPPRSRPKTVVADLDHLIDYARSRRLPAITRVYLRPSPVEAAETSRRYTLQKLQPRPFKIMFGNLRVSPHHVSHLRSSCARAP
jgi:hypothetical protein